MRLTIEKLTYGGDGLARLPADEHGRGKAVFLPFVLGGEQVEASITEEKPGFARAKASSILQPSPRRVEPRCPYFSLCGGCYYQHTDYQHQLEIKAAILKESLRRIAKLELDVELQIHPSPAWNYRNRTRLRVQNTPSFALCYHRFASNELLPVKECPISSPLINRAIASLLEMGKAPDGLEEIELFANAGDTQLLLEAYSRRGADQNGLTAWAKDTRAALPEAAGVVFFPQSLSGATNPESKPLATAGAQDLTYITDQASYRVSAGSFFQVNRHLTSQLVTLVTANHAGHTALDLYAGAGLFALVLARQFERVLAVESADSSYADLRHNVPVNVKPVRATVEQYLQNVAGRMKPDLVVVDPPRSGLGARITGSLAGLAAPRLTYVSCDPATLARDVSGLLAAGYRVQQAHLVDLFPQTCHLESVFHLVC